MASGDTLCVLTPAMAEPPSTNFATIDTQDNVLVLDFDDTTEESIEFSVFMPKTYGGGGLTVTVGWLCVATTGNAKWDIQLKSITDNVDALGKAFATEQTSGSVAAAGTTLVVSYDDVTFTDGSQMDSIAAGEYFRLKIAFDRAVASVISGDATLVFISIEET